MRQNIIDKNKMLWILPHRAQSSLIGIAKFVEYGLWQDMMAKLKKASKATSEKALKIPNGPLLPLVWGESKGISIEN